LAQNKINSKILKELEVPLPSLAEQQRLVRILDEAEALRRLRTQADERAIHIEQSLFQEMFGDPALNPNNWPVVPVSTFVHKFQAGRSVAPAGEESDASNLRIVKVSAVTWGQFASEESKPVPASYTPTPDQFVRAGDMLFPATALVWMMPTDGSASRSITRARTTFCAKTLSARTRQKKTTAEK